MLPPNFISQMETILGHQMPEFLESLKSPSPISVRINKLKKTKLVGETVPWCQDAIYLNQRPNFAQMLEFQTGAIYPQEASSMFLSQFLDDSEPLLVLDLCSAPGGKTTLLLDNLHPDSLIFANEIHPLRFKTLKENLYKWGRTNIVLACYKPLDFANLKEYFDLILVDAPCSGEGMFRKEDVALEHWSSNNVNWCEARQKQILKDILGCLKVGGNLIYSTCTYNTQENENVVEFVKTLGYKSNLLNLGQEFGFAQKNGIYKAFPHKVKGEGFAIASLTKMVEKPNTFYNDYKPNVEQVVVLKTAREFITKHLPNWQNYTMYFQDDKMYIYPNIHKNDVEFALANLKKIQPGMHFATLKGKSWKLNSGIYLD
jgi:16S rRNA C967 or C1407 C5-methylase (RsmB/RsmF family)